VSNHSYSQLFELSPFPAVVSRLDDHRVLAVNASAAELVGVSPADAIGQPVSGYYVDPAQRLELTDRVRRDGRADNVRLHIKRARGEPLWVLASIRVIDWNGEAAALTVFHDISEQLAA
jgi:PAS domain S-box-containing protein